MNKSVSPSPPSAPDEELEIYRRFARGEISRSRAESLIGDNWEEVAQIVSMRQSRNSNQQNGYSADELSEMFA